MGKTTLCLVDRTAPDGGRDDRQQAAVRVDSDLKEEQ